MSVDMFIKIGDIKGESKDAKYKDQIDVLAWSWGAVSAGSPSLGAGAGSGAGSGQVTFHDLSITKHVDAASPVLLAACCQGKHFPEAILAVRKAGQVAFDYFTLTLKEVLISSILMNGNESQALTESVTVTFAEFKLAYKLQDKTGRGVTPITAGWNLVLNKKV